MLSFYALIDGEDFVLHTSCEVVGDKLKCTDVRAGPTQSYSNIRIKFKEHSERGVQDHTYLCAIATCHEKSSSNYLHLSRGVE